MSLIQQLRSFRLFKIALLDVIASVLGLYLLLKWLKPNRPQSFYIAWVVVSLFPITVLSHLLTQTPTMLNYYLGLSVYPDQ